MSNELPVGSHTPGPWVVRQDGGELLVLSSSTDFCGDPDCFYICSVHGQGDDDEEKANAHLIATAPDLLLSLLGMVDLLGIDAEAQDPSTDTYACVTIAKQAIAAAHGTKA